MVHDMGVEHLLLKWVGQLQVSELLFVGNRLKSTVLNETEIDFKMILASRLKSRRG